MCTCRVCKHKANDEPGARRYRLSAARACSACLELKILQNQIIETRAFLCHLQKHLHALRSNYNHAHDPFTHALPPELMSRIFEFCVSSAPNGMLNPLILGAVCKRWRQIAWAAPNLWTTVRVNLDRFQSRVALHCELLSQWLARSAQLPLSIWISCNESNINPSMHPLTSQNALEILNQYSARWQCLDISMPLSLLPVLRGRGKFMPILKNLIITQPSDSYDDPSSQGEEGFLLSNVDLRPETVSITRLPFNAVHIDWSNVTEVYFDGMTTVDCLCLFQQAIQLVKCSITIDEDENVLHFDTPFIHPSLAHITIIMRDWNSPDALFDRITLPALKEANCMVARPDYDGFISLVERSGSVLTSLSIANWEPPSCEGLSELLRTTSRLEYLMLRIPDLPPGFFELFAPPESSDSDDGAHRIFLPLLRRFHYRGSNSYISWKSFIEAAESMLRIRRQNDAALPSFEFIFDTEDEDSDSDSSDAAQGRDEVYMALLCGLIDRGIGLKISDGSKDLLQREKRRFEAERFGVDDWDGELG
ncbi:unnamed protein product [Cyclocybe aegerita]|uniref:F-box domain-containing protein n=1 Tax=Cyclocybe aegerita TaxID=1973307 RepID=A0A8S0X1C4_CYCAE|nr:unnamed protein product [Cyclocybe aegerita]